MTSRPFLSLKWKAVLVFSLLLLLLNSLYPLLTYFDLKTRFAEDSEQALETARQRLDALVHHSGDRLQLLAEMLPLQIMAGDGRLPGESEAFQEALLPQWLMLQQDHGVEGLWLFDRAERLLYHRASPLLDIDTASLRPLVAQANSREQPVSELVCTSRCWLVAVTPLLIRGHHQGVSVLVSGLTDVVVDFAGLSDQQLGLFGASNDPDLPRTLAPFGVRSVALTGGETSWRLLRQWADERPQWQGQEADWHLLERAEGDFQLALLPLREEAASLLERAVVIRDVSQSTRQLSEALNNGVAFGLLGLLFSGWAVWWALKFPVSRLQGISQGLPLLAQHRHSQARERFGQLVRKPFWQDELDYLLTSVLGLTQRLQDMEQELEVRAERLTRNAQELRRERDFVRGLLDTAQVIILTQDAGGRLCSINRFGAKLSGYDAEEISTFHFSDLVRMETLSPASEGNPVGTGQDGQLLTKNGKKRDVLWLHSPLSDGSSRLSVGLDVTERKAAENRLAWLADHDSLTGVYNRRRLQQEIELHLEKSRRSNYQAALLIIDLDQFKYINDTSGHSAGDSLLRMVANALGSRIGEHDVLARLGGDEYAIVAAHADAEAAGQLAERIQSALSALVFHAEGHVYHVEASIGIALIPEHGISARDLLANGDMAMYQAKEAGRRRHQVYRPGAGMRERMEADLDWKQRLEEALEHDQLVLHFQPIQHVPSRRIIHYEALLRIRDGKDRFHMPGEFIAVAERSGLIRALDEQVLTLAVQTLHRWQSRGESVHLSVNLSAHAFQDVALAPRLQNLLAAHDIDRDSLVIEVTETAALADVAASGKTMQAIRELGVRIALDDFGVGFSSLSHLKQLPFDYIKIDGSFIRELVDNPRDRVLVQSLCDIARGLNKKTVAEFVENEATAELLRRFGVDYLQGYYIGRPVPRD